MEALPFRILALTVLIVSLIADTDDFKFFMRADMQFLLGVLVVAVIIFGDAIVGFTLGLAVFVVYMRVYSDYLGIDLSWLPTVKKEPSTDKMLANYITPENLKDAQNNVFDMKATSVELKGIQDPYGKGVMGAQGMDSTFPGIDTYAPVENWTPDP